MAAGALDEMRGHARASSAILPFSPPPPVSGKQAEALVRMDTKAFVAMGVHPLVPFLANRHLEERRARP